MNILTLVITNGPRRRYPKNYKQEVHEKLLQINRLEDKQKSRIAHLKYPLVTREHSIRI